MFKVFTSSYKCIHENILFEDTFQKPLNFYFHHEKRKCDETNITFPEIETMFPIRTQILIGLVWV